jgi:hypothetical protein
VGERFHGCFSLDRVLPRYLGARAARLALGLLGPLVEALEDRLLSDFAEITRLEEGPDRWLGEYRYLEGTPIAGRSRFVVEALGPGRCRFEQLFEYQERGALAVEVVQRLASRLHDQVTLAQVHAAARLLAAEVTRSTIPAAYAAG